MDKKVTSIVSLICSSLIFIISLVFYFILKHKFNIQYVLVFVIVLSAGIAIAGVITYNYFNYKVGEMFYLISSLSLGLFYLNQSLIYNLLRFSINNSFLIFLINIFFNLLILANIFLAIYPKIDKKDLVIPKKPKKDLLTLIFGSVTSGLLLMLLFLYLYKQISALHIVRLFIVFVITLGSILSVHLYDAKLGRFLSIIGFIIIIFHLVNFLNESIYFQLPHFNIFIRANLFLIFVQTLVIGSNIMYLSFLFFKNEEVEVTILKE